MTNIFDELCKGNSSILTLDNIKFISSVSMLLYDKSRNNIPLNEEEIATLKTLIMICNLTYNRTDGLTLPVEDGVYDLLNEKYKSIDPNFQVGSVVVQFKSEAEKKLEKEGKTIIQPFKIVAPSKNNDEISVQFRNDIRSFDKNRYNYNDLFYQDNINYDMNISKRVHNTEHNHPDLIGTLDKAKFVLNQDAIEKDAFDDSNVTILERDFFGKHITNGIISPTEEIELVLELKYDGISVEADCTDIVVSARTRGDTNAGLAADITPMLYGYRFTRNEALKDRTVGVKFEAIMTKSNLDRFNIVRGTQYANCRTAIIGLFGASDANKYRDFITLIPLALDRNDVPEITDRHEEIELLNRIYKTKGEPLRHVYIKGNYQTCLYLIKKFVDEAKYARNYLDFMFDGVVVSYTDEKIRVRLGRQNYINKYSMAVKFDPETKLTTFLGYTFEVGQAGNITPMIHYAPIEFFGALMNKSSGASLNRFNELALRPGDIIEVSYNNDVMCYVNKFDCEKNRNNAAPLCEFPKVCPICGTPIIISDSGKSAICPNVNCDGRRLARMSNMLQKMNIKGFADSTINQLGVYSFHELMELKEEDIQQIGPTNAHNLIEALNILRTTPQEDYKIMGALGFTNLGPRKWKLILSDISLDDMLKTKLKDVYDIICNIKGLGPAAAQTYANEIDYYYKDMKYIVNNMNIIDSSKHICMGKQIRFSGVRNSELENQLQKMGHDADGTASVSKKTDILIIPYSGYTSTKTSKVSTDCMVVPIDEFMSNMNKYIL